MLPSTSSFKAAVRRTAAFIDHWHWALLALAAPWLLFPSPSRVPVLLIVPGLWLVAWLAGHPPVPRTPLNGALLLLSVMVLVSLYATYDIAISLPKIAGMALGIGAFYAVVRLGQRPRGWWLSFLAFLTVGVGIAGLGLLGTQWIAKIGFLTPIISRLPPVIVGLPGAAEGLHPNQVAGALLWVIPMLIVLTAHVWIHLGDLRTALGRSRAVAITGLTTGTTLFVLGTFVLTQSRSGYVAFVIGGLGLVFTALPPHRRRLFLGFLALVAIGITLIISLSGAGVITRELIGGASTGDPAFSLDTFEGRLEVWSRALYAIQDFPFTGMGMNTFRHVVHVLYPLFLIPPDVDIAHAHNEFLQAALDLGLPGLIAFIALYLVAFSMLRQLWHSPSPLHAPRSTPRAPRFTLQPPTSNLQPPITSLQPLTRPLVLGLAGGLIAHLIYGLTDAVALGAKPGILFWMLLGLIAALFEQTHLPAST